VAGRSNRGAGGGSPFADPEGAARVRALVQAVQDLLGRTDLDDLRALDLGAGGGEIAGELAARGATVVAVEGRRANADAIRSLRAARGLAFDVVEYDVRRLDWVTLGGFDLIVCSGLLYHLELPDALALVRAARGACRLLLVDTEVAWGPLEQRVAEGRAYAGLTFVEHDARSTAAERDAARLASLDNVESFWLTRDSLHALLQDAGFSSSWELGAPGQPRRSARVTVAALAGAPVEGSLLDPEAAMPDARPVERERGRLLRARVRLARLAAALRRR
jgi:SAM-dependent methyltransferase